MNSTKASWRGVSPAPWYNWDALRVWSNASGRAYRTWQREALLAATSDACQGRPLIRATMGAGKSHVIGALAAAYKGRVLIVVPSVALVKQTFGVCAAAGLSVGVWYGERRNPSRVTVACIDSLGRLLREARDVAAGLVIVDECHKAQKDLVSVLKLARVTLGFSATPYRADGKGLVWWDRELYSYGPDRAIADGVLVSPRVVMPDKSQPLDQWCIDMIKDRAEGPGIVSAYGITDADEFAAALCEAGVPAAAIHSAMTDERREAVLADLHSGAIRCAVHVRMLTEGVDLPWLRWLCMRRNRGSRVEMAQEAGRLLRSHPGKVHALIFDPHLAFLRHEITGAAELMGLIDDAGSVQRLEADKVHDPLTGEALDWSAIDASERRRVKALVRSWSYISQAALVLRIAGKLPTYNIDRQAPATARQLLEIRRQAGFAQAVISLGGRIDGLTGWRASHARAIALGLRRVFARVESGAGCRAGVASDSLGLLFAVLRSADNAGHGLIDVLAQAGIDAEVA